MTMTDADFKPILSFQEAKASNDSGFARVLASSGANSTSTKYCLVTYEDGYRALFTMSLYKDKKRYSELEVVLFDKTGCLDSILVATSNGSDQLYSKDPLKQEEFARYIYSAAKFSSALNENYMQMPRRDWQEVEFFILSCIDSMTFERFEMIRTGTVTPYRGELPICNLDKLLLMKVIDLSAISKNRFINEYLEKARLTSGGFSLVP
jgi:hypothetical protein